MEIKVRPDKMRGETFHNKAMKLVFKGHLKEFKEWYSYPKSNRGAFSARTKQNPV